MGSLAGPAWGGRGPPGPHRWQQWLFLDRAVTGAGGKRPVAFPTAGNRFPLRWDKDDRTGKRSGINHEPAGVLQCC